MSTQTKNSPADQPDWLSPEKILAFQQAVIGDLLAANQKAMDDNAALCLQLRRPSAAFVLSVDPVLGVDIHFSNEIMTQAVRNMTPGLQRLAQKMDVLLRQYSAAKSQSPKKKAAATKANASAKTKKAQ